VIVQPSEALWTFPFGKAAKLDKEHQQAEPIQNQAQF
jgi:hypothetical protein